MTEVVMKTKVNASAEELWKVIGDFNGLPRFMAVVASSYVEGSGVGSVRTLFLADGAKIRERLEQYDPAGKKLVYSIVEGPLPVRGYLSTVEVSEAAEGKSELSWSSTFTPDGASEEEAKSAIAGIYRMGFEGLKKLFG